MNLKKNYESCKLLYLLRILVPKLGMVLKYLLLVLQGYENRSKIIEVSVKKTGNTRRKFHVHCVSPQLIFEKVSKGSDPIISISGNFTLVINFERSFMCELKIMVNFAIKIQT